MTEVIPNKEAANKAVSALVREAYAKLEQAQEIADTWGLSFSFSPAYGMGGTYYSPTEFKEWYGSDDYNYDTDGGWISSSRSC